MEKMSSRERVRAQVTGLPVDRVPVFVWINAHTGARMMAEYRPARRWSWNLCAKFLWKRFQEGGASEARELWRLAPLAFDVHTLNWANAYSLELGADLVLASYATPWQYSRFFRREGKLFIRDIYGVTRSLGSGIYPDAVGPAIREVSDLKTYRFPDPKQAKLYNVFRRYRRDYPEAAIAAEVWGPQDFTATSLFGMERFMVWLIDYPDEMKEFIHRWTDYHIEVARQSVAAGADVVFIEDDYGYDHRPLISLEMWQEFTLPELKRLIDAAHDCGALACLHSCGYQMPFLPYYVEAGLDLLHAFQPKAGNDFSRAYAEFGDKLAFITGIDIQRGESMRPEELRAEILDNYRLAGRKGRHVLGTTHEIQYTMPEPNLRAIFETVAEIQAGRHDG